MGTGYIRNDGANNIANGNVIDAADLDGEFDAIVDAFHETTGHTHDGTAAEGAPITVVGPAQEYLGDGTSFYPKLDATYDLGKASSSFNLAYLEGLNLAGTTITATAAELNYVDGVTSAIQTQLNNKQPLDSDLTAIAALAKTDGNFIVGNGTAWVTESGATVRSSLGLGTAATTASTDYATAAQGTTADAALPRAGGTMTGNITMPALGTVDGRDLSVDGTKLDNIETGATADQTAAEIKAAYESNANTNEFSDSEQTKLAGIETGADVTDTTNVTAAGALMDSEVTNLTQVKAFDSADYATAAQGTLASTALQDITGESIQDLSDVATMSPATGQALVYNGAAWSSADMAGGIAYVRKTANYTTEANEGVIADTTGGTFTVTLPATPATGDTVVIVDGADWNATNLTVGRNGSTIEGDAADMVLDIGGVAVQFTYDGTTWQAYTQLGAASGSVLLVGDNVSDLVNDAGYLTSVTELTQVQVEDDTSTVFGQVSGQRLGQAIAANAGGGLVFISSADAAGDTSLDFTGFDSTLYDSYVLVISNLTPVGGDATLRMLSSSDGGSTFDIGATDYSWGYLGIRQTTSPTTVSSGSTGDVKMTMCSTVGGAAGEEGVSGTIEILGPHLARDTMFTWVLSGQSSSSSVAHSTSGGGRRNASADVDAVQLYFSSSRTIGSGTATLYGRVNA